MRFHKSTLYFPSVLVQLIKMKSFLITITTPKLVHILKTLYKEELDFLFSAHEESKQVHTIQFINKQTNVKHIQVKDFIL